MEFYLQNLLVDTEKYICYNLIGNEYLEVLMKNIFKINTKRLRLSRWAELVFLVWLPIILIELLWLLAKLWQDYLISPAYAVAVYAPMFEYIMMSLAILVGGTLLFDYIVKSYK